MRILVLSGSTYELKMAGTENISECTKKNQNFRDIINVCYLLQDKKTNSIDTNIIV
jgi:hypothetical protein